MMGILYGWATKEYILEKMSFGQIVMYVNYGAEFKWRKQKKGKLRKASEKTDDELRVERAELRKLYGKNIEGL